eukprot:gene7501-biopygen18051
MVGGLDRWRAPNIGVGAEDRSSVLSLCRRLESLGWGLKIAISRPPPPVAALATLAGAARAARAAGAAGAARATAHAVLAVLAAGGRNGRGRVPDASHTIEFKETDASRTRPEHVPSRFSQDRTGVKGLPPSIIHLSIYLFSPGLPGPPGPPAPHGPQGLQGPQGPRVPQVAHWGRSEPYFPAPHQALALMWCCSSFGIEWVGRPSVSFARPERARAAVRIAARRPDFPGLSLPPVTKRENCETAKNMDFVRASTTKLQKRTRISFVSAWTPFPPTGRQEGTGRCPETVVERLDQPPVPSAPSARPGRAPGGGGRAARCADFQGQHPTCGGGEPKACGRAQQGGIVGGTTGTPPEGTPDRPKQAGGEPKGGGPKTSVMAGTQPEGMPDRPKQAGGGSKGEMCSAAANLQPIQPTCISNASLSGNEANIPGCINQCALPLPICSSGTWADHSPNYTWADHQSPRRPPRSEVAIPANREAASWPPPCPPASAFACNSGGKSKGGASNPACFGTGRLGHRGHLTATTTHPWRWRPLCVPPLGGEAGTIASHRIALYTVRCAKQARCRCLPQLCGPPPPPPPSDAARERGGGAFDREERSGGAGTARACGLQPFLAQAARVWCGCGLFPHTTAAGRDDAGSTSDKSDELARPTSLPHRRDGRLRVHPPCEDDGGSNTPRTIFWYTAVRSKEPPPPNFSLAA